MKRLSPIGQVIQQNLRPFAAAVLLCLFLFPIHALAGNVVVVKEVEIKPYRDAIRGFKNSCGCDVTELELSDNNVAEKILQAGPDAVVSVGTRALRKVKSLRNVPVIYLMAMPSETAGLTADNISGVSMNISPDAYLAEMVRLFPRLRRIGLLSDPANTGRFVESALAAARARGLELVVKNLSAPQQAPRLLAELRDRVDLLWMLPDATVVTAETADYLMLFSFQNKIPLFSFARKYVELGAVAALTISPYDMGAQAGAIFRQLSLGDDAPAREYAKKYRLTVNKKVAAKLGIVISDELMENAETLD